MKKILIAVLLLCSPAAAQTPLWVGDGSGNIFNTNPNRVFIPNLTINNQPGIPFQYGLSVGLGSKDCSDSGGGIDYVKLFSKQPLEEYFQINYGMHCDPIASNRYAFFEAIDQHVGVAPVVINPNGGGFGIGVKPAAGNFFDMQVPKDQPLHIHALQAGIVEFNMGFIASGYNFYINTGSGNLGTSGVYMTNGGTAWISNSDARLKKDITKLDESKGLSLIMKLKPVTYHFKRDDAEKELQYGFVAQDIKSVLPDIIRIGAKLPETPDGANGFAKDNLIPSLVLAIQQLQNEIQELKNNK